MSVCLILFFKEQKKVAILYVNLVNAEVAMPQLSDWADVLASFRQCLCSALSFDRIKLQ